MATKKVNAYILVAWFVITLFCLVESTVTSAKAQTTGYQTTMIQDDPAMPSSRYVLDKLNQHISDKAVSESQIKQDIGSLEKDVSEIKSQKIGESMATLIEKEETDRWMLRAILAGIIAFMGKEAIILLNRKSKG